MEAQTENDQLVLRASRAKVQIKEAQNNRKAEQVH